MSAKVCVKNLEGLCSFGAECRNQHFSDETTLHMSQELASKRKLGLTPNTVCNYGMKCGKINTCGRFHVDTPDAPAPRREAAKPRVRGQGRQRGRPARSAPLEPSFERTLQRASRVMSRIVKSEMAIKSLLENVPSMTATLEPKKSQLKNFREFLLNEFDGLLESVTSQLDDAGIEAEADADSSAEQSSQGSELGSAGGDEAKA